MSELNNTDNLLYIKCASTWCASCRGKGGRVCNDSQVVNNSKRILIEELSREIYNRRKISKSDMKIMFELANYRMRDEVKKQYCVNLI